MTVHLNSHYQFIQNNLFSKIQNIAILHEKKLIFSCFFSQFFNYSRGYQFTLIGLLFDIMSASKYLVFFVTFFSYSTLHVMRMSISFIKTNLMQNFHLSKFEVGLGDALLYLTIGLSYLYRMFAPIPFRQIQNAFFRLTTLSNLGYLILPFLIIIKSGTNYMYFISLVIFGIFQTSSWPIFLEIISIFFQRKKDGCMLGLWSSSGDVGNVLGFSISTFILYQLKLEEYFTLLFPCVCSILFSIWVKLLDIKKRDADGNWLEIDKGEEDQAQSYSMEKISKIKNSPSAIFLILSISILKAILYAALLWLPMYFEKSGFQQYKGYIPVVMNGTAILGSLFLGYIYQKVQKKWIRDSISILCIIFISLSFYFLKSIQFTWQNRMILLIVIGFIGFWLMANFNILVTHEVSSLSHHLGVQVRVLSSLVLGIGNVFVGALQFIIGILSSEDSSSIFLILLISTIVTFVVEIARIFFRIKEEKEENDDDRKQDQSFD